MRLGISGLRAAACGRAGFVWVLSVCSVVAAGCSRPTAAQSSPQTEQQASPAHEDGVVTIQQASRPFIEVEEVSATKSDSMVSAPARVDFRDGAVSQVGVPLDGRVQVVHVLVGQKVRIGDPLVTLDCPDAAAMRASIDVAQASLREARLELERQRRMQDEGVGTGRDLVAAETKVSAAEAEVARTESGAHSIGAGTAAAVVVRAPITGIVIVRKASVGMAVQRGGDPLIEIGDASALWIVADVFERDLAGVHVGATGRVTFASVGHDLLGRVNSVGTVVGSGLRTAPVYLSLDASSAMLRPGMYGRVEIQGTDAAVTLPTSAVLIKDGSNPVVYVQKDPLTYLRRPVVLAQPVEGRVQIVSGLSPGEKVVVRGALLLDGSADQLL
jgi:cobalt-zinc-cadmium efflux system membrane fusion protein